MHTSKLYKYTVLDTVLIELDWKKKEDYTPYSQMADTREKTGA